MASGNLFENQEEEQTIDTLVTLNSINLIFKGIEFGKKINKDDISKIILRCIFDTLNLNIYDCVDIMALSDCDNSLAMTIMDSPEFLTVKEEYFKCSFTKNDYCVVCELYQNRKNTLLQRFDDFLDFNILDHYVALYIYYVMNGEIEDLEKLYNDFKDKYNFQKKNEKAKKKALKWLVPINGEDDEMVIWINNH